MRREDLRRVVDDTLGDIAPEADLSALPDQADLRMELDIDSIGYLEFITALHEKLGVEIPEAEAARLNTREAVLDYLAARLQEGR